MRRPRARTLAPHSPGSGALAHPHAPPTRREDPPSPIGQNGRGERGVGRSSPSLAMESFLVPLLFVGFLALVVAAIVGWVAAERRRREALAALAARRGWRYVEGKDRGFEKRFPEFECLRQGSNRYAERLLVGESAGRALVAFDYHYETKSSNGKTTTTTNHRVSGLILDSGLRLAPLSLRSETFGDRLSAFFGMGDLDFELAEFNRAFHVRSPDRRFATDVLQPATLEFLLASPRFRVEFGPRRLLAWRERRFEGDDFERALALIEGILERLPPSFVHERTATA